MKFTKIQAAGNDYILVETGKVNSDWSKTAVAMLDRHYGIGADGLLLLMPSKTADFKMRIFNADGSESEACGNGLRCMVRYYIDNSATGESAGEVLVETMAGIRKATVTRTGNNTVNIRTGMGAPEFSEKDIPVTITENREKIVDINNMLSYSLYIDGSEYRLNLVSMGNPHAVYFYDGPVSDFPLSQIGQDVERDKIFPRRTNFEVARVLDRQRIEARIWERGVGETLASGSGSCAITVTAHMLGSVDDEVDIGMPGGTLKVEWDGAGEVFLSGPAQTVFSGEWPD